MQTSRRIEWRPHGMQGKPAAEFEPMADIAADLRPHCAYNQTRECFLGLEVVSYASLEERLAERELRSGEGLWLTPFHGIPMTGLYAPLDLIYLDKNHTVIETVESHPTFVASSSRPSAASVLVLPAHSIYLSQTQVGDQLVLCIAEEMEGRLERLALSDDTPGVVQGAVLLREQPLWGGGPGLLEFGSRSKDARDEKRQTHEMSLIEPGIKSVRPPKNWLERWWSPDPRKAPREAPTGLAAYYWNGAAPKAHKILDISTTGLYLETEERWYPGTLVLMTLQKTSAGEKVAERSISVMSRAVRWGNDGVGLQFVLPDEVNSRKDRDLQLDGAGKRAFAQFLQALKKEKD